MHNIECCVIRKGEANLTLAPFHSIEEGDTVFCNGYEVHVSEDAHQSGDASYDGYLLFGDDDAAYYPEDLDTDLEMLNRSLSCVGASPKPPSDAPLFRGKVIRSGDWVEGFYHYSTWYLNGKPTHISHYILPVGSGDAYEVDPETIGQYIGRRDNHRTKECPEGRKMFNGDIFKHYNNANEPEHFEVGIVAWYSKEFRWANQNLENGNYYTISNDCNYEVIGNIWDNKELTENGKA